MPHRPKYIKRNIFILYFKYVHYFFCDKYLIILFYKHEINTTHLFPWQS